MDSAAIGKANAAVQQANVQQTAQISVMKESRDLQQQLAMTLVNSVVEAATPENRSNLGQTVDVKI